MLPGECYRKRTARGPSAGTASACETAEERDGYERKHTGQWATVGGDGPHRHPHLPAVPHHRGSEPDGHHHAQQHGGYAAFRVFPGGAVHQPVPDLLHGHRHGRVCADIALLGQPGHGLAEKERCPHAAAQCSLYHRVYGGHSAVPGSGHADVHAGQRHHRLRQDVSDVDAAHVPLYRPVPDLHRRAAQRGAGSNTLTGVHRGVCGERVL